MNQIAPLDFLDNKTVRLFLVLAGLFIANAIIAEAIGVKIFSLEQTFGFAPVSFSLFGEQGLAFDLSVGVMIWPVVFVMTDIINEYYGVRGVRFLSMLAAGLIAFMFCVFYLAIRTVPAEWWQLSQTAHGVPDMQAAFNQILGQGMSIIIASLTAFIFGQLVDATVFKRIKIVTGERRIWMRATLSTLASQLIDTLVVSYMFLYFSMGFSFPRVTAIVMVSYTYKFAMAILCTPLVYLAHYAIERYLGRDRARALKLQAIERQSLISTD
ncbi:MAG: queuosine precursor transporter [Spongiibacteraceae bacterium]